ncbi:hypothetical protein [Fibrisoma montanum]|uniref:hypothetical protein n=1 Tax=Fibrisoma montanum TaxID=2305895 RepID=UPI0018F6125D|nr:hypothetical protein [Fibrisoma montanum]
MKRFWIRRGLRFLGFAILFVGLAGLAVMALWNALLPSILGVSAINFGQALGLLVLSRLLFGGFRGYGYGPGWRRGHGPRGYAWKQKMAERWQTMTPEEREQLRQQWRNRCGGGRYGREWRGAQPEQTGQPPQDPTETAI